jgi:hypothetical protein
MELQNFTIKTFLIAQLILLRDSSVMTNKI